MSDALKSAGHAMHVGWVKSELELHDFVVRYVPGEANEWTCRLHICMDDPANSFDLIVPAP
jgi:hypothetical protein